MPDLALPQLSTPAIAVYNGDIEEDVKEFKTAKEAESLVGGLSNPSKMPCHGYSIPASRCHTGSKLKDVEGSVCYACYAADDFSWAKQGKHYTNYAMDNVKKALARRFDSLSDPMWVPAMVRLVRSKKSPYFRWHDSGDIQSVEHLQNIARVAKYTPGVSHWLPTREYNLVRQFLAIEKCPDNLCIRVSAHMVDKRAPAEFENSSMVVSDAGKVDLAGTTPCRAYENDHKCGTCRACWSLDVGVVWYPKH